MIIRDIIGVYFMRRRFRKYLDFYFAMVEYPDRFVTAYQLHPAEHWRQQLISGFGVRLGVASSESGSISKSMRGLSAPGRARLRKSLENELTDDCLQALAQRAELIAQLTYGFGWPIAETIPVHREDVLRLFDELSTADGSERFITAWVARIQHQMNVLR